MLINRTNVSNHHSKCNIFHMHSSTWAKSVWHFSSISLQWLFDTLKKVNKKKLWAHIQSNLATLYDLKWRTAIIHRGTTHLFIDMITNYHSTIINKLMIFFNYDNNGLHLNKADANFQRTWADFTFNLAGAIYQCKLDQQINSIITCTKITHQAMYLKLYQAPEICSWGIELCSSEGRKVHAQIEYSLVEMQCWPVENLTTLNQLLLTTQTVCEKEKHSMHEH